MSPARGWNIGGRHPPREVPCRNGCGKILVRRAYFNRALCDDCKVLNRRGEDKTRLQEARRYRILMHIMGYDPVSGFKECQADLKESEMAFRDGPETRVAKVDRTVEKRVAREKRSRTRKIATAAR